MLSGTMDRNKRGRGGVTLTIAKMEIIGLRIYFFIKEYYKVILREPAVSALVNAVGC